MVPSVSTIGASVRSTPLGMAEPVAQTPVIIPLRTMTFPWLMTLFSFSIVTTRPLSRYALLEDVSGMW